MLAQRTRQRVVRGGGETGRWAARSGAVQHAAALRAWQCGRGGARRGDTGAESGFENGCGHNVDSRGKWKRRFFYFYFLADGSVACWVVFGRALKPTNACPGETGTLPTAFPL
jgi:hypothetical protein